MRQFTSRRRARALACAAATATVALAAVGCGSSSDSDSSSASTPAATQGSAAPAASTATRPEQIGRGMRIGFVSITNCANPLICAVGRAFAAEARALGAQATVLQAGASANVVDANISNMDQLTSQKVDAIAVWPADEGAIKSPTQRAAQARIPVFGYDLYQPFDRSIVMTVNQGRALQAKQSAELLCRERPDGGPVLFGNYALPLPSITYLRDRFEQYLKQCSGGRLDVAAEFANRTDDVSGARTAAEPAIQANPDVVGIASYNDATAIGASQAAQSLGKREQAWISGYNLAPDGVDALKEGRIDVSWDYQPAVAGQVLARAMIEYLAGKQRSPPSVVMVWPKCYTTKTIDEMVPQQEQVDAIAAGVDVAARAGPLVQSGDAIPAPGDDLPGCDG
ncbi:sugar ABC transporter substrate-binding protein [Conexibacter sp. CPCC 206217]|uniref:sugar ABC transporter substrate-binding protein n=1 Tax=Conexibacter sp. CPCC 206217 TaxID=3064574 RepID=UPI00271EB2C0|nr:sugar ABC transporter substrate-binding protein [Conexibacter sp. CPCC 206217]MDO8210221.1 sugar ABC transporter substrate-binding protein [Conexibacter sp. CPCC 206217]